MNPLEMTTIRLRLLEAIPLAMDKNLPLELYPAGTTVIARAIEGRHAYEDLVAEGRMELLPDEPCL